MVLSHVNFDALPRLSGTAIKILAAVKEFTRDGKPAKTSAVAAAGGISRSQAQRILAELSEAGAVQKIGKATGWVPS